MNSHLPHGDRHRSQDRRKKQNLSVGKNITVFSAGGKLHNTFDFIQGNIGRSQSYTQIDLGRPVVIEFLRFFVPGQNWEKRGVEILVSNHLKTKADKEPSAESIVYYDKNKKLQAGQALDIKHWGANKYGHPLCYYSKSYRGESIAMTTYVSELDKIRKQLIDNLEKTMDTMGKIPLFLPYIQYFQVAKLGAKAARAIANFINTNDMLIPEFDLDLHFVGQPNQAHLQSGRYVCLPNCTISQHELINHYELKNDNRLINLETNKPYDGAFFIFRVDSYENPEYEEFEYYFQAASILSEINKKQNVSNLIHEMVELAHEAHDIETVRKIEELAKDQENVNQRKMIKAYWNDLSEDMQSIYKNRYENLHI